jgi:hypothetical protein
MVRVMAELDNAFVAEFAKVENGKLTAVGASFIDVQVDIDATGTLVGVELLSLTAELPMELLHGFAFPPFIDAPLLSRIWPSITYASMGQGQAYMSPVPQPA